MQVTLTDNVNTAILPHIPGGGTITSVKITWPAFATNDGYDISSGSVTVPIDGSGALSIALTSNSNNLADAFYTFTFAVLQTGVTGVYSAQVVLPAGSTITFSQCSITAPWYSASPAVAPTSQVRGTATITPGAINDMASITCGTTISVAGAVQGQGVAIGVTPDLPAGVFPMARVTAPGVVSVSLLNLSGGPVNLGASTYTATVFV